MIDDEEKQKKAEKLYATKADDNCYYILEENEKLTIGFDYSNWCDRINIWVESKFTNLDDIYDALHTLKHYTSNMADGGLAVDEILQGITAEWETFLKQREEGLV